MLRRGQFKAVTRLSFFLGVIDGVSVRLATLEWGGGRDGVKEREDEQTMMKAKNFEEGEGAKPHLVLTVHRQAFRLS